MRPTVSSESWARIGHERRGHGWARCPPDHTQRGFDVHTRVRKWSLLASPVCPVAIDRRSEELARSVTPTRSRGPACEPFPRPTAEQVCDGPRGQIQSPLAGSGLGPLALFEGQCTGIPLGLPFQTTDVANWVGDDCPMTNRQTQNAGNTERAVFAVAIPVEDESALRNRSRTGTEISSRRGSPNAGKDMAFEVPLVGLEGPWLTTQLTRLVARLCRVTRLLPWTSPKSPSHASRPGSRPVMGPGPQPRARLGSPTAIVGTADHCKTGSRPSKSPTLPDAGPPGHAAGLSRREG